MSDNKPEFPKNKEGHPFNPNRDMNADLLAEAIIYSMYLMAVKVMEMTGASPEEIKTYNMYDLVHDNALAFAVAVHEDREGWSKKIADVVGRVESFSMKADLEAFGNGAEC